MILALAALALFSIGVVAFAWSLRDRAAPRLQPTTVVLRVPLDGLERDVRERAESVRRIAEEETGVVQLADPLSETAAMRSVEEKSAEVRRLSEGR